MIKIIILIFIFLHHFSSHGSLLDKITGGIKDKISGHANKNNSKENDIDPCEGGTDLIERKSFPLGKTHSKICIPKNYLDQEITHHPSKYLEPAFSPTNINIAISKFEVISIGDQDLTLSFELQETWFDNRLQILNYKWSWEKLDMELDENKKSFKLAESEQDALWVPKLEIETHLISENTEFQHFYLSYLQNINSTHASKKLSLTATAKCELNFKYFPFDRHHCSINFEDQKNETYVESLTLKLHSNMKNNTNDYTIEKIEEYSLVDPARFGIKITFKRSLHATNGILINYNLMCGMIVVVSSINFLVDPKIVPGRAGLLVTLFLVLTNFFCKAQDEAKGFNALTIYILICMTFIATAMMYYGLILFKLRKILKIKDHKMPKGNEVQLNNSIIKFDRFMLVLYGVIFIFFNVNYFLTYCLQ